MSVSCPHCKQIVFSLDLVSPKGFRVSCSCGLSGPIKDTIDEATDSWESLKINFEPNVDVSFYKDCPFCTSKAIYCTGSKQFFIRCWNTKCSFTSSFFSKKIDAILQWNCITVNQNNIVQVVKKVELINNQGRDACFKCGAKTTRVDSGFSIYNICPVYKI